VNDEVKIVGCYIGISAATISLETMGF